MNKMLIAAAALSLALAGPALAQGSNQGQPNTLHGSGNMMQDGPHASSVQQAVTDLPAGETVGGMSNARSRTCYKEWKAAQANGTIGGRTKSEFMSDCLNTR